MYLPEAALHSRGFGEASDELGARMGALVREVPEHVREALAEHLAQPGEDVAQVPAVRTQEVAEEHEADDVLARSSAAQVIAQGIDGSLEPKGAAGRDGGVVRHS